MILSIIKLCRPQQWAKNLFVLLPLFFSGNMFNVDKLGEALIAIVSFCLASSAVYCLNDLKDAKADKLHPRKRFRPVASGRISSKTCIMLMIFLLILAELTLLFLSNNRILLSAVILNTYVIMNIAYCLKLKRIALIDVIIISLGFVLRVAIGGTATEIYISHWIIMMTFLLALFLSLSKRRDDIVIYNTTGELMRNNITRYNLEFITQSTTLVSTIMLVCYIMYTVSPDVIARFDSNLIYVTSVFVLLGLLRYIQLTVVDARTGSPTRVLLHDRFVQLCILGWILTFAVIIYL